MPVILNHINFPGIENRLDILRNEFNSATPFQRVVIDDFLYAPSLAAVLAAIPGPDPAKKSSDYLFARNKFENPGFAEHHGALVELKDELLSERFSDLLVYIFGRKLFVDPTFLGGGIHQGGEGSFLDMHADFSRHPAHRNWLRELNILLYLNQDYDDAWGGHLDLLNARTQVRGRIAPIANRMVLMLTKEHTLHGYKSLRFPKGRYRTSLAGYAYSIDTDFTAIPDRSTMWKPEDAGLGKSLLAKAAPALVKAKTRLFGSSTERRARKMGGGG